MKVSTAYVQLYHPEKHFSEALSNWFVLNSVLSQLYYQYSSQILQTRFDSSISKSNAGVSSAIPRLPRLHLQQQLPAIKVYGQHTTFNSELSSTPHTPRHFFEILPQMMCFLSIQLKSYFRLF